jgi:hypothetical protein
MTTRLDTTCTVPFPHGQDYPCCCQLERQPRHYKKWCLPLPFPLEARRNLVAAARWLDLEGIVAKRKADPYRPETVWYEIKSRTYTQGEGRWELFQRK